MNFQGRAKIEIFRGSVHLPRQTLPSKPNTVTDMKKENISIFKPHLLNEPGYKGGKTLNEVASDKKIYKLSSNENLLGSSPKALEALRAGIHGLHNYPDRTTHRMQVALEKFYGGELKADNFICANSGSEILELTVRAFLDPGLECIISNPAFSPYKMFSTWQGAKVVDVPLLDPDFSLDVDGILNAINNNTRLIFVTSPNNPTGTYVPKKDLDKLIENMPAHVILVLDEVYYKFAEAEDYTTALPYVKAGKNVIAVNSFSKTYGLAAVRSGYGYSTPEIAGYIRRICKPFILNTLSMNASIAALSDTDFLEKTMALIKKERPYIYSELNKMGIKYWPSQSNFILIKPNMDTGEFEDKMLAEGIMVRQANMFGAPGCVRVTIGTREANDAYLKALAMVAGRFISP